MDKVIRLFQKQFLKKISISDYHHYYYTVYLDYN